ncbi:hypothetical protein CSC32_5914 [Pseudomonas aeruginosa]|nr:hypothetical protein CSC32_5914 [Pseudomonas aeruginosa]RCG86418.1 hypothetical protein CSB86_5695 [Pseudomonas aeruginosa]
MGLDSSRYQPQGILRKGVCQDADFLSTDPDLSAADISPAFVVFST